MNKYSEYILDSVIKLSRKRKVKLNSNRKFAFIQCPNKNHKSGLESTPSLRVNIEKSGRYPIGSAKCFSCGFYLKNWKEVGKAINRPDLVSDVAMQEAEETISNFFDEKTNNLVYIAEENAVMEDIQDSVPWNPNEDWRSISGKLLADIKSNLYFDENVKLPMLYLPCHVNGKHIGGVKANLVKRGKNNYFNTPGEWVKNQGLFPYDYTAEMMRENDWTTVCIVEGPRDSLNWVQNNIPTVGILGSENWTDLKADLILSLPNIERVIIAFDPDEAGDRAKRHVYASLKDELEVKNFDFRKWQAKLGIEDDLDPGNCPKEIIDTVLNYIR